MSVSVSGAESIASFSSRAEAFEAEALSQATSQAMLAARSILLNGGSQATALSTARAAAQSTLEEQTSASFGLPSSAPIPLKRMRSRRKFKRQAELVASVALMSVKRSIINEEQQQQEGSFTKRPATDQKNAASPFMQSETQSTSCSSQCSHGTFPSTVGTIPTTTAKQQPVQGHACPTPIHQLVVVPIEEESEASAGRPSTPAPQEGEDESSSTTPPTDTSVPHGERGGTPPLPTASRHGGGGGGWLRRKKIPFGRSNKAGNSGGLPPMPPHSKPLAEHSAAAGSSESDTKGVGGVPQEEDRSHNGTPHLANTESGSSIHSGEAYMSSKRGEDDTLEQSTLGPPIEIPIRGCDSFGLTTLGPPDEQLKPQESSFLDANVVGPLLTLFTNVFFCGSYNSFNDAFATDQTQNKLEYWKYTTDYNSRVSSSNSFKSCLSVEEEADGDDNDTDSTDSTDSSSDEDGSTASAFLPDLKINLGSLLGNLRRSALIAATNAAAASADHKAAVSQYVLPVPVKDAVKHAVEHLSTDAGKRKLHRLARKKYTSRFKVNQPGTTEGDNKMNNIGKKESGGQDSLYSA